MTWRRALFFVIVLGCRGDECCCGHTVCLATFPAEALIRIPSADPFHEIIPLFAPLEKVQLRSADWGACIRRRRREGIWGSSVLRRVLKVKRRHKGSRNETLFLSLPSNLLGEKYRLLNQIAGFLAGCSSVGRRGNHFSSPPFHFA